MKKSCFFALLIALSLIFAIPVSLGLFSHAPQTPKRTPSLDRKDDTIFIQVYKTSESKTEYVALEDYLPGVVAAEMPASFEVEALKAQAVAARSYILSRLSSSSSAHPSAVVCDNPNHCKAYITEAEARSRWGSKNAELYLNKIRNAVAATNGEYMVCGDEIVEAFFFAESGGRTENSEDVWGESRPYLKSVASAEDSGVSDFYSFKKLTVEEFRKGLYSLNRSISQGSALPDIGNFSRTEGGSIKTITVDGEEFKGSEIRTLFGLKSANFEISVSDGSVTFKVAGHGHGVGMSQSGANQMAKNGKNYTEILSHYYTNIQIMKL